MNSITISKRIPNRQLFASIILIIMSIQFVPIEGFTTSPIKIILMSACTVAFLLHIPYRSKATWACILYWLTCFCVSLRYEIRFNTLGYLGLFLITYITYYNLIYKGAFSLTQFQNLLRGILITYTVVLLLQQFCIILGINNFPLLNLVSSQLDNQYYEWNRLPALSCEPSHTARIVSAAMLGYIRCLEIRTGSAISITLLFKKGNKLVTFCYLWLTFMMGSGTGWIGFGIVSLYFIRKRTFFYIIPLVIGLTVILYNTGNTQLNRAINAMKATITGDIMQIVEADQSGSVRIVPLVNTFLNTDLSQTESWLGGGTLSEDEAENAWADLERKISIVEQYGLLGLIASLIFLYTCAIDRIFSIETLLFMFLLMLSLNNIYIVWSMIFIFTTIKYFQKQQETKSKVKQSVKTDTEQVSEYYESLYI